MNSKSPDLPEDKKIAMQVVEMAMRKLSELMVDKVIESVEALQEFGVNKSTEQKALNAYQIMMGLCSSAQRHLIQEVMYRLDREEKLGKKLKERLTPEKMAEMEKKIREGDTSEMDMIAKSILEEIDAEDAAKATTPKDDKASPGVT